MIPLGCGGAKACAHLCCVFDTAGMKLMKKLPLTILFSPQLDPASCERDHQDKHLRENGLSECGGRRWKLNVLQATAEDGLVEANRWPIFLCMVSD
jgi:hypothetical protein